MSVSSNRRSPKRLVVSNHRDEIHRAASLHGANNVRIFGSYARGEADSSSDVDLLVDLAPGANLFDLVALSQELEAELGVKVDVLTENGLSPHLRDQILAEAIAL